MGKDEDDGSVAEEVVDEAADLARSFVHAGKVRSRSRATDGYGRKMHGRRNGKVESEDEKRERARKAARKRAELIRESEGKAKRTEEREAGEVRDMIARVKTMLREGSAGKAAAAFLLLAVVLTASSFASCSLFMVAGGGGVALSSYLAEPANIRAADTEYDMMEIGLRNRMSLIESQNPGKDEYRLDIADIGHDPHALAALLTVLHGDYDRWQAALTMQWIFDEQYHLTSREVVERRTRTVTRWAWFTRYTEEIVEGETIRTPYQSYESYEVTETYNYSIYYATLTNAGIDAVARNWGLSDEQLEWYDELRESLGNMDEVFW